MAWYMVVLARIPLVTESVLDYSREVHAMVHRYGGQYLVLGGPDTVLEGTWPERQRLVVSRWESKEALLAFWHSAEYQDRVKPLRADTGDYDVVIYEEASLGQSPNRAITLRTSV